MSVKNILPEIERLEGNIDALEDVLKPLLSSGSAANVQLPLLDKAKVLTLTAYAINALLHSTVRVDGQAAESHPVSQELKRVQQYFAKIKAAENANTESQPGRQVDTEAIARILKHNLATGDQDLKQRFKEQAAKGRTQASSTSHMT